MFGLLMKTRKPHDYKGTVQADNIAYGYGLKRTFVHMTTITGGFFIVRFYKHAVHETVETLPTVCETRTKAEITKINWTTVDRKLE